MVRPMHSASVYGPAIMGTYTSFDSSRKIRIRDLLGLTELYRYGSAWYAEQIASHERQPLHLSASIFIVFILLFTFLIVPILRLDVPMFDLLIGRIINTLKTKISQLEYVFPSTPG